MTAIPQTLQGFRDATRVQQSALAGIEKRCLVWMAHRMPRRVNPDHLTVLGFAAMCLAGACYALAHRWPPSLLLVNVCLAVNWFGDSLDGTLARTRQCQRPRYGFYVDHIVDSFGALFLICGLALSGYMSWWIAVALLVSFYLLSVNAYLATYTLGTFQLSYGKFSPTELRILLSIGNAAALLRPNVTVFGMHQRLFDVSGVVAAVCMAVVLIGSVVRNTIALYRLERL